MAFHLLIKKNSYIYKLGRCTPTYKSLLPLNNFRKDLALKILDGKRFLMLSIKQTHLTVMCLSGDLIRDNEFNLKELGVLGNIMLGGHFGQTACEIWISCSYNLGITQKPEALKSRLFTD